jgi:hypothetical protein
MTEVGGMAGRARPAVRRARLAAILPALGLHLLVSPVGPLPAAAQVDEDRAQISFESLSDDERGEVLKGRVVLRTLPNPGSKGRTYEAIGILQGSLDEAFAVLTDFVGYPEFMPNVGDVRVCDVSAAGSVVEVKLHLPLGVKKQYRLRFSWAREESGFALTWEKLPWPDLKPSQTIADTSGFWSVRGFEYGGLLAVYHVYTDPGHVPLGLTGIAQGIAKRKIPDGIIKVRERIRRIFGPGRE